jgi:predicted nucleotidyltransferase
MIKLFEGVPEIEKVILYGSRATGSFERGSDVDLAISGKDVSSRSISNIHFKLENESPTLLKFDILWLESLENVELRRSIEEKGVVIYEKIKEFA